ncbi:MAG: hypothetical protein IJA15_03425 [Clostridia bacterium]|nr:hypothetical protein [Clostridia bacterium]
MDKEFYLGMLLGVLGGALVAANSIKVRKAVKDGQEQVLTAINNLEKKNNTAEQGK